MNARCPRISKYWNKTVGDWNCVCQEAKMIEISCWLCCDAVFFFRGVFFLNITILLLLTIFVSLSFLARFFSRSFAICWFFFHFSFWLNGSWPQRIWSVIISYYFYKIFLIQTDGCLMFNVVMVFTVNYVIVIYHLDLVICHRTNHKIVSN